MPPLKVLVCAYACNPVLGSESGVGWNWVLAIAKRHTVWVLTDRMNEQDIEAFVRASPTLGANLNFQYVESRFWHYRHDSPFWQRLSHSFLRPTLNATYLSWQRGAYRLARELISRVEFDLVHQLTMVGFRFPGSLWRMGLPFVWGPIGGLENIPWRLFSALGIDGATYYAMRNIINSGQTRWLRSPLKAMVAAGGVIAATSGIRREIERIYGVGSHVICEVTPPPILRAQPATRLDGEPLRLFWCGEHLPGKALPLALHALTRLPEQMDWRLDIFGDGPKSVKWRSISRNLGLGDRCKWNGRVPRWQVIEGMKRAHIFVISSLKDLTSTVLLEALSQGLPVLCPNHCGFPDVVTPECGMVLPIDRPERFIRSLAKGINILYHDEDRRRSLAAGALRRALDFSVDAKAEAIDRVYSKVIALQHMCRV